MPFCGRSIFIQHFVPSKHFKKRSLLAAVFKVASAAQLLDPLQERGREGWTYLLHYWLWWVWQMRYFRTLMWSHLCWWASLSRRHSQLTALNTQDTNSGTHRVKHSPTHSSHWHIAMRLTCAADGDVVHWITHKLLELFTKLLWTSFWSIAVWKVPDRIQARQGDAKDWQRDRWAGELVDRGGQGQKRTQLLSSAANWQQLSPGTTFLGSPQLQPLLQST